jgi:transposase
VFSGLSGLAIGCNCFYKWQRRYQEEGIDGLRDRSSRPHHSPNGELCSEALLAF